MEQGLSLCPDFVVPGTHENKLTMKISQITAYSNNTKEGASADRNLKSLAGLVSELWPSLLNWWRVAVLFFGEHGRKGGGSPSAPSVGSIESFTLEQLQARSDRIVLGVL